MSMFPKVLTLEDSATPSVMILVSASCHCVYAALDVLVTVPLGVLLLILHLKLCQVHRVSQEPPNASKPSAELAAFLQTVPHFSSVFQGSQR